MNSKSEISFTLSMYLNSKLEQCFPNDPFSDITIIFANKNYKLQKAYLRFESEYFSENFESENVSKSGLLLIGKKFEVPLFDKILRCFYGGKAIIYMNEIYSAVEICHYLRCTSMISQIIEQLVQKFEGFNFFMVYSIGYQYSNDELLEKCFNYLKETNFKVLLEEWVYISKPNNKYPNTIFSLMEDSFKNLIKMHNQLKINAQKQNCFLSYTEIYNIIKNYVKQNITKNEQTNKLKEMIFELIDKNHLSSKEYKSIYHQDFLLLEEEKNSCNNEFTNKNESGSSKIDLISSENFLFRKEMEELRNDNNILLEELKIMRENFQKSQHYLALYEEKYNDLNRKYNEIKNEFNNNYIKNEMRFYEMEMIIEEMKQEIILCCKQNPDGNNFFRTFSEKTTGYSSKLKRNSLNPYKFHPSPMFRKSTGETKASKSDAISSNDVKKNTTIMKQVLKNSEIEEDNELLKQSITSESFALTKKKNNIIENPIPTYSILKIKEKNAEDLEKSSEDIENIFKNIEDKNNLNNIMKNICLDKKQDSMTQESYFLVEKNINNLSNYNYSQIINQDIINTNIHYDVNYKDTVMLNLRSDFLKEDSDFDTLKKWFDIKMYQKLKLHLLYKGSIESFNPTTLNQKIDGIKPYIVFFNTEENENNIYGGFIGHSEQELAFEIKSKIRIDYIRKEKIENEESLFIFGETFKIFSKTDEDNDGFVMIVEINLNKEDGEMNEKKCLLIKEIEIFQILIDSEMEI